MVPVCGNGENDGRDTHRIYETNNEKAGAVESERDVGYTNGGASEGIGSKPVGNNLHCTKTGYGNIVGGAAANI